MAQEVLLPPVSKFSLIQIRGRVSHGRWFLVVVGIAIGLLVWGLQLKSKDSLSPLSASAFSSALSRDEQSSNVLGAQQSLQQYLSGKPSVAEQQLAFTQLGDVYLSQHQYASAIQQYQKAASMGSANSLAIDQGLAMAYDVSGQKTKAITYYQKAIVALDPKDIGALGEKIGYTQRIAELEQ